MSETVTRKPFKEVMEELARRSEERENQESIALTRKIFQDLETKNQIAQEKPKNARGIDKLKKQANKNYHIDEFGQVVRDSESSEEISEEQAKHAEHANLDYMINSHPDRLKDIDAARERRAELEKELGLEHDDNAVAEKRKQFRAAILKMRETTEQQPNTNILEIISQQKQNG